MIPDDEEELADDQPEKQPRISKGDSNFMRSFEARKLGKAKQRKEYEFHLQAYAEDELVRKEYKEMVSLISFVGMKCLTMSERLN